MSFDTTLALIALHLNSDGYFPLFLKYYKLDQDFKLFFNFFKLTFQRMPHLLASGFSKMIFNTFNIVFTQKIQQMDSCNYFNFVLILSKVILHLELHVSLARPAF
jgi:hypothetical protein